MALPQAKRPVVLAIDQGTTGTTALIVDQAGEIVARGYREVVCQYPQPGWVEQDAEDLWERSLGAIAEALQTAGDCPIVAIGIANQRETTILWDAQTGRPVAPAIVWQCRRTAALCDELRARGLGEEIAARTGLVIDPYFSATKIRWLFDADPTLRARAAAGQLRFGTVDSWLIWKLSGGQAHRTDYSNAARTMLYNIYEKQWDPRLLEIFDIPTSLLPTVGSSQEIHARTVEVALPGRRRLASGIPIAGVAGDQQAALFGQACFEPGMVKCTYGTGAFLLMNRGETPVRSRSGLLTTLGCGPTGKPIYVLEGSIFIAGAAVQWLRDQLGIIRQASETEELARQVPDTAGVYFVPAFVGLGAPYWDTGARGALIGLTRGTERAHLARAALEAIAYQTRDVVDAMAADAGIASSELRIDGGAAANDFLAQFQADILGTSVVRPRLTETTGLGAAYLAGLAVGFWSSHHELAALWQIDRRFRPTLPPARREALYLGWCQAVARVRS